MAVYSQIGSGGVQDGGTFGVTATYSVVSAGGVFINGLADTNNFYSDFYVATSMMHHVRSYDLHVARPRITDLILRYS